MLLKKRIIDRWDSLGKNGRRYLAKLLFFFYLYAVFAVGLYVIQFFVYAVPVIHAMEQYLFYFVFLLLGLFSVIRWKEIQTHTPAPFQWSSLAFFLVAVGALFLPIFQRDFISFENASLKHFFVMFVSTTALYVAVFGWAFVKRFAKDVAFMMLLIVICQAYQILSIHFWKPLSFTIVWSLSQVMPLFTDQIVFQPSCHLITAKTFQVTIFPPCAGFDSFTTFTLLYLATLGWMSTTYRIRYGRAIVSFLMGLAVVFLFNIIRIGIIVAVGAFWSPELALNLFHTYLSAIFLLAIFFVYLRYVIPKIIEPKRSSHT